MFSGCGTKIKNLHHCKTLGKRVAEPLQQLPVCYVRWVPGDCGMLHCLHRVGSDVTCFPGQMNKTPTAALPQLGPLASLGSCNEALSPPMIALPACFLSPGPDLSLMLINHLENNWPAALPSHHFISL